MASINSLAKILRLKNKAEGSTPADVKFLRDFIKTIELEAKEWPPSPTYKPSSIGGCMRNMYYQIIQAPTDNIPSNYMNVGIGESGTMRHECLQTYVTKMKEHGFDCDWMDVEEVVKELKPEGTRVERKSGMETKCRNDKYNLSFLCDGVIRYRGQYYILEIKTESTYKFITHDDAFEEHKMQATCYSIALGIDDVIFLYENRDVCEKKTFLVHVTEEMKRNVIDKILDCDNYVDDHCPPPKCENIKHCQYCKYKRQCKLDGDTE